MASAKKKKNEKKSSYLTIPKTIYMREISIEFTAAADSFSDAIFFLLGEYTQGLDFSSFLSLSLTF
jgi:hypothetical protein